MGLCLADIYRDCRMTDILRDARWAKGDTPLCSGEVQRSSDSVCSLPRFGIDRQVLELIGIGTRQAVKGNWLLGHSLP